MGSVASISAPDVSAPSTPPPAFACDTHSHVFGPFDSFPPLEPSSYALPAATHATHAAMRRTLGIARGVLVQPAPYGNDPAAMLHAIAASKGTLRGIGIATPRISDAQLESWSERGVVGLRFTEMHTPTGQRYPGSVGFDALAELAPRMRALGMHAQLWATVTDLASWLPRLLELDIDLVLDHMGCPNTERGVVDPAFATVLDVLADGPLWIKLAVCRVSKRAPHYADARSFHDAYVTTAPDRMLWGSDWPYVRLDPAPDAAWMLDLFTNWIGDLDLWRRILVDNPARLYRFEE